MKTPPLPYRLAKRGLDIGISVGALAVGFVPSFLLCAVVAADTKSTPIYTQIRVGKAGKPFTLYKFRTMVPCSDDFAAQLADEQMAIWRSEHKLDDDPRVTRFGRLLRQTSIDEFPQFLNVLLGQMSVVGPRPITFEELDEWFAETGDLLTSVRPGITGAWQVGPRNKATFASGERQRIELSYVENASLGLDAKLFFRTFKTVIDRTGK